MDVTVNEDERQCIQNSAWSGLSFLLQYDSPVIDLLCILRNVLIGWLKQVTANFRWTFSQVWQYFDYMVILNYIITGI
jgi:hypothetical protein